MTVSLTRADDADKQRAFLILLANPVVTAWTDPGGYGLVHRHAHTLGVWCARLGYQLAHLDQCYRLRRTPIAGTVAQPEGLPPERALLLLVLYAAACLDDHRDDSITLQELSDTVRLSAAGRGGWPYDPNLHRHRTLFISAMDWLVGQGVLERLTDDILREGWAQSGQGIGAGYRVHRDALVLFVDTGDVDLALRPPADDDDTRRQRLLRLMIETQALYPGELDDDDRSYLTGQRLRLAGFAEQMTGGTVESRADAIVLSIPPDRELPDSLLLGFPAASARDWAALAMIDRIGAATEGSFRTLPLADVRRMAADVWADGGSRLTAELRESPAAVVAAVGHRLAELGLLRTSDDDWTLTPLAGRYRDAQLSTGESTGQIAGETTDETTRESGGQQMLMEGS